MKRHQTSAEICDLFDITPQTLVRWVKQGCPVSGAGSRRRFDGAEVAAWKKANPGLGVVGRPRTPISEAMAAAKLRKEEALATQHEIQVGRELGELVLAEDAKAAIVAQITGAKNKLMGLGAAIAPALEGMPTSAIQQIIETRISEILAQLGENA